MDLNRVTLIGNLVKAPQSKALPSGMTTTSFQLATTYRPEHEDTARPRAEYHDVRTIGKLAEIIAQYVKAGSKVYVEGRLHSRSWKGKDGGQHRRVEVVADNLIMLGHRPTPKAEEVA